MQPDASPACNRKFVLLMVGTVSGELQYPGLLALSFSVSYDL